jgi:uncharacterized protein (TIGR00730 family)
MLKSDDYRQLASSGESGPALTICVFCGSRTGHGAAISAAARELGELIGRHGHNLVYGAGGSGLMGEIAGAAARHGAPVTGYAPRFIYERELGMTMPEQTLRVTDDLFERKRQMIDHADAFIALPGGYGTLDEIMDVLSLTYLSVNAKPLILLNTENFWNGLIDLATGICEAGFADRGPGMLMQLAGSPADALTAAEQAVRAGQAARAAQAPASPVAEAAT